MAKKLYGTDPDQVPTNADLGTMAYQDAERPSLGQTTLKSAGTSLIVERTGDAPNLQLKGNGQNLGQIYAFQNGAGGNIAFYPTNSVGSLSQRMIINRDGNVTINDGNLVLASGHGIDFSATSDGSGTMSSELLDDYEEGTWTPKIRGTGAVFAQSYSTQIGNYTKVGRMVYCTFHIQLTDIGSITGDLIVAGLPFSMKAENGVGGGTIGFADDLGAAASAITINNAGGQSYAYLQYYPSSNSAAAPIVNSTSLASSTMRLDGTVYFQTS